MTQIFTYNRGKKSSLIIAVALSSAADNVFWMPIFVAACPSVKPELTFSESVNNPIYYFPCLFFDTSPNPDRIARTNNVMLLSFVPVFGNVFARSTRE